MNLDELHKMMKGDMTVDQACEGMTDDFEIGHVSHRADGDYRKVAQGKWVPVKAAGQAREFSETENHGAQLERQKKADAQAKKNEAVREQRAQGEAVGKSWKTAAEEWIKKNPNYKEMSADDIIKGISKHMAASEKPAEQKGGKRQLKRRADGTIIYETPDDVIYDMVENYNELDRGDLQGVIEAAAMSHGWDENEILEEVDRQAAEKYDLNVDAAPGIAKKAVELAQRDYTDVPGRVLTADTKIRLSRIKREQTQDERRTYRIGEISEKTGLQKTANGWREVKKGASPAGGKAEVNPITGKPLRPETVAYAKQKKAEAEQKRNTEKTAGGFTLAQNDKIKNAATDVIFKRRGEKLTPADLQREYKMSEPEAKEASRSLHHRPFINKL